MPYRSRADPLARGRTHSVNGRPDIVLGLFRESLACPSVEESTADSTATINAPTIIGLQRFT
jgi:hypothetical protein